MQDVVILYHAHCPDGFGAAFAAWKKFGERASYIPVEHNRPYPEGLDGKEVFICDFSYPHGLLLEIEKRARRLVVLDHHIGAREWVEQVAEHIFDNDRSGAGITWDYLHPHEKRPTLISYIEDGDLDRNSLPDSQALLAFIYNEPRTFEAWDTLCDDLEHEEKRARMTTSGTLYTEHFTRLVEKIVASAKKVSFEGFECFLASAPEMFASDVGYALVDDEHPIALIARVEADRLVVSIRSNGTVDVASLAKKYDGGGHPTRAGFRIPYGTSIPWQALEQ
jgi:uncharacterized protein